MPPYRIQRKTSLSTVTSLILLFILVLLVDRWRSYPGPHTSNIARRNTNRLSTPINRSLITRGNDGNDADPNWLSPDDISNLDGPLSALSEKGQAVKKGKGLECIMKGSIDSVTQSPWTDINSLAQYGYSGSPYPDYYIGDIGLNDAFQDLGLSSDTSDWYEVASQHSKETIVDGQTYPVNHALFTNSYNLRQGAIVSTNNYGAKYRIREAGLDISDDQIVPLWQWSNVVYLQRQQCFIKFPSVTVAPIKHIFRHNLIIPRTQDFLKLVSGKNEPGPWPGVSFPIEEFQALAALSSDNGKGVAWLLGQHKESLGIRTVDRINIFNCPSSFGDYRAPRWCLYLHILDV